MGERTQVNLQVHPDQKKEWESFADSEGLSLSAMIRQAVSAHVNESTGNEGDATDPRVSDVLEQNKRLQSSLNDLTDDMVQIKNAIESPTGRDRELSREVFRRLPKESQLNQRQSAIQKGLDPGGRVSHSGAIEDIAESLNVPENEIRDAMDRLTEDTNQVHEVVIDGTRRYYR